MAVTMQANLACGEPFDPYEYWRRPTYFTPVRPECYCLEPEYFRIHGDLEYHFLCKKCKSPIPRSKAK